MPTYRSYTVELHDCATSPEYWLRIDKTEGPETTRQERKPLTCGFVKTLEEALARIRDTIADDWE